MHSLISRRPLSDAEMRLHEAAKNGKCDEILALAAAGTDMNCPDPDNVSKKCIYHLEIRRADGRILPSNQLADLLWRVATMQLETWTVTSAR